MSGRRAVRYSTLQTSPEQAGDEAARKKIAEADALQQETERRRAAATPSPVLASLNRPPTTNRQVRLGGGTALDEPNYLHSRYAYGSQHTPGTPTTVPDETAEAGRHRMDVQREHEFGSFFHPDQSGPAGKPASPASAGPLGTLPDSGLTITPTGFTQRNANGSVTVDSQYGGGTSRNVKPNELVQPYFATEKGNDLTHTILPKKPGEDPNLDPIYAANVFRKAGDEKTALAYEKHAGTMNPSQFTGPNGAQWNNPHFLVPNNQISPKATAALDDFSKRFVEPGLPGASLAALATPPSTKFTVPPSLASIPAEETFAGKPLSAITDITSGAPAFPSGAFLAGQTARETLAAASPLNPGSARRTPGLFREGAPETSPSAVAPSAPVPNAAYRFGGVGRPPGTPAEPLLNIPQFSQGFASGGASTAAGVSRATAADFQKPTQANPLPTTPTTPVDRGAIASFGGLDNAPAPAPTQPKPPPVDDRYVFKGF